MICSNRLLPGYIFTIFKRGEMIRLIIDRCFIFIEHKNIIGKAFLPKIVHDFQVDEITRPSLEMLERLGEHMTWGVHRAQPGYYRFPEILFRKRKYSKLGDPFFWGQRTPRRRRRRIQASTRSDVFLWRQPAPQDDLSYFHSH